MSAPANTPVKLKYRPAFDSLPYQLIEVSDKTQLAHQSFPFLLGYRNISFEEQRLEDMKPPPPMATGRFGLFTQSALRSLKAACQNHKASTFDDVNLIEPLLPIVNVRVSWKDHGSRVFAIHSNILEHCSPFFKTLLKSDSEAIKSEQEEEGPSEQDKMSTVDFEGSVVAFQLYTEWVYSGLIQKRLLKGTGAEDVCFHNIGQAYILGEKLQDHKFKNAIVDLLLDAIVTQGRVDLTLPTLIFDKSSAHAPLRELLVDLYVLYGHKDWLKPDGSINNSAVFLSDLSTAFLARNTPDDLLTTNISTLNGCRYHEHPEGKLCPIARKHPREVVESNP